ncbi:cytochrome b [uncultured Devosia sp.]|uniref:cytochrome b n=1 Tax=uncultured Devosia sp. TaxID=211434 RepID=UPI0026141C64|nr:cytochrome b [uncultured Devosia sp.]
MTESAASERYDGVTIGLHWLSAILVLALFGSAMAWTYLPREMGLRWLTGIHVSLGVALTFAVIARLTWRLTAGRRLHSVPSTPLAHVAARIVHMALYGLLLIQIGLGFGIEWLGGSPISLFGLVDLPSPFAASRELSSRLESVHGLVAWMMMALVGGHAAAALWHHYAARDSVMTRMIPRLRRSATSLPGAAAD